MIWQADQPRLVLASASAARRAVLEAAGLRFEVRAAALDEAAVKQGARDEGMAADDAALLLAALKAARIGAGDPEALVIGCDQLLVCAERWFDKPSSIAAARESLLALRGREHVLVTAVLCQRDGRRLWQHVARPRLWMRSFSESFLDAYLAREGDAVCAAVGGYRIEGLGIHLFERLEGEHATILGLPLLPLLGFLRQHGVLAG